MCRRDQRLLLALACVALVLALLQTLTGLSAEWLLAVPGLVLLLPLLAGRYVGEDALARLISRYAPRRRLRFAVSAPLRAPRRLIARGALLLGASLAKRGPPVPGSLAHRPG
jgi:hypothetical protein